MARTINEIHTELKDNFIANTDLQGIYGLDPSLPFDDQFSRVSIENLFLYVVAVSMNILENLFDDHKADVDSAIALLKPHSLKWYVEKARMFQYGDSLVEDKDYYDPVDEAKQIVSHCAVDEKAGKLYMKVAKDEGDGLAPLAASELTAFTGYMERVKDAGVNIHYISQAGDDLRLAMDIWYDPLVIGEDGKMLDDSTREPAKETIKDFIKDLPFNGEFVLVDLVDALQATDGIDIPTILQAESKYGSYDWTNIDAKVVPEAGYLVIDDANLTLNYRANVRS